MRLARRLDCDAGSVNDRARFQLLHRTRDGNITTDCTDDHNIRVFIKTALGVCMIEAYWNEVLAVPAVQISFVDEDTGKHRALYRGIFDPDIIAIHCPELGGSPYEFQNLRESEHYLIGRFYEAGKETPTLPDQH